MDFNWQIRRTASILIHVFSYRKPRDFVYGLQYCFTRIRLTFSFQALGCPCGLGVEDADQVSEFTQFESSLGPLLRIIPPLSPLIPCHSPRIGTSRVGLR